MLLLCMPCATRHRTLRRCGPHGAVCYYLLLATASASFEGRKEHIKLDDNGIVGAGYAVPSFVPRRNTRGSMRCVVVAAAP